MKQLQRLSMTYVPEQDRLRIAASINGEGPVALWFSRRMLQLLLPELLGWLAMEQKAIPPEALSLQQAASQLNQVPAEPVVADKSELELLVTTVDMKKDDETFSLLFPLSATEKAVVSFNRTTLAQWLAVLYQKSNEADWALSVWPDWFCEAQGKTAQDFGLELH